MGIIVIEPHRRRETEKLLSAGSGLLWRRLFFCRLHYSRHRRRRAPVAAKKGEQPSPGHVFDLGQFSGFSLSS
jgi:hypothetical protein